MAIIGDLFVGSSGEVRRRERQPKSVVRRGGVARGRPARGSPPPSLPPPARYVRRDERASLPPPSVCVAAKEARRRLRGRRRTRCKNRRRHSAPREFQLARIYPRKPRESSPNRTAPRRAAPRHTARTYPPRAPSPRSTSILLAPCPRCSLRTKEQASERASALASQQQLCRTQHRRLVHDGDTRWLSSTSSSTVALGHPHCWYAPVRFLRHDRFGGRAIRRPLFPL